MKMLKDCDVEPGDIIVYKNRKYEFVELHNCKNYQYRVINLESRTPDAFQDWVEVYIIKKDPKKEILQKIEDHKSEIQILENQLKEMNSLKVGEVYRVTEEFFKDGVLFYKGEMLYLEFDNNVNHIFRSNISLYKRLSLNSSVSNLELVNDPEMKNGLYKFFKGNS